MLYDAPSLPHQDASGFRGLMQMGADLIEHHGGKFSVSILVSFYLMIVKIKFIP